MPVCAKKISSWLRKVLNMGKTHVSKGLQGAVASAVLVVGVSLVSILQAGDWPEFLLQLCFIFQHISVLLIGIRILCSVHSPFVDKYQILRILFIIKY